MAERAKKGCAQPGCPKLTSKGNHCNEHRALYNKATHDKERQRFYKSKAWRLARGAKLATNMLCERCYAIGLIVPATDVHHVTALAEAPALALSQDNLESLCRQCHSRETAYEVWGKGKGAR